MPEFIDGLARKAFHPIISFTYAINAGLTEEVAAPLGYFVKAHRPVPVDERKADDLDKN